MPEFWKKDGATWRKAKEFYMKQGATWRKAKELWVKDGATWRKVFGGALSVSLAPSPSSGACSSLGGSCSASTNVTATPTGGSGTYTYSWTYVSGDSFTITGSTLATASFSKTNVVFGSPTKTGVYRCTVNDGTSSVSADVTVNLTFNDLS